VNRSAQPIVVSVIGRDEVQVDLVRRGVGIAVLAQGGTLAVLVLTGATGMIGAGAGACYGLLCDVLLAGGLVRSGAPRVGIANAITWTRCVLVGVVVALVPAVLSGRAHLGLALVAGVALLLDGVDGRVARATATVSPLGSRFDMEVDASLVLALSVAAAGRIGPWVLVLGSARYLLLLATLLVPRLAAPTAPRLWRKAVAALQGVVLTVVCAGVLEHRIEEALAVVAALALAWSFGTEVRGLLLAEASTAPVPLEPVHARHG
jgi:phosphatidylglycerophosphate synthase